MFIKKQFYNIAAFIVCGTFCFSAVTKILYWSYTIDLMQRLVSNELAGKILTVLIIILELMLAISIYDSSYWRYTGSISAIVLFIFGAVAIWGKSAGRITQCPCFGKIFGGEIGTKLIIRNVILIIWSFILAKHKTPALEKKLKYN